MKLSEVGLKLVKQYARIDGEEDDLLLEYVILPAARGYVLSYTGRTAEAADELPELAIAYLKLCGYLYDHRDAAGDQARMDGVLESLLGKREVQTC